MICAIYARKSSEQTGVSEPQEARQDLSVEDREFIIDKLAEILVKDYCEQHGLNPPTTRPSDKRGEL